MSILVRRVGRLYFPTADAGTNDGRVKLDSHADDFVARSNCVFLHQTESVCNAMSCLDEHEAKTNIPIA